MQRAGSVSRGSGGTLSNKVSNLHQMFKIPARPFTDLAGVSGRSHTSTSQAVPPTILCRSA